MSELSSFRIPVGTEIFPFARETEEIGPGRLTTVEVTFEKTEAVEHFHRLDPKTGQEAAFFCLELPENPSPYDSYIVRVSSVDVVKA